MAKVTLSRSGMVEALTSPEVEDALLDLAELVAASYDGTASGEPMEAVAYTYPAAYSAAAGVVVRHPAALHVEAVRGSLMQAALGAGLRPGKKKKKAPR